MTHNSLGNCSDCGNEPCLCESAWCPVEDKYTRHKYDGWAPTATCLSCGNKLPVVDAMKEPKESRR